MTGLRHAVIADMQQPLCTSVATVLALVLLGPGLAQAQSGSATPQANGPGPAAATRPSESGSGVATGTDFAIGPDDVLGVLFWRDQDMTGDVTVRPDGMITLPLIRDIKAAGLKPNELADRIQEAAREFISDPVVTVVVRQMNSRRVFIAGEIMKPGTYPLTPSMTVMQLIAVAGGFTDFADTKGISIMRVEGGERKEYKFNYNDVVKGKKREQNLELKPGDTVVVP